MAITKPSPAQDGARENVLLAAHIAFAAHPYATVTLPRMAEMHGLTLGALEAEFSDQAGLFAEVMQMHWAQRTAKRLAVLQSILADDSNSAALAKLLFVEYEEQAQNPQLHQTLMSLIIEQVPSVLEAMHRYQSDLLAMVDKVLSRSQKSWEAKGILKAFIWETHFILCAKQALLHTPSRELRDSLYRKLAEQFGLDC